MIFNKPLHSYLVRVTGLEPASLATHEPESCVFANFTIPANYCYIIIAVNIDYCRYDLSLSMYSCLSSSGINDASIE